jgi:hypothetical protein
VCVLGKEKEAVMLRRSLIHNSECLEYRNVCSRDAILILWDLIDARTTETVLVNLSVREKTRKESSAGERH